MITPNKARHVAGIQTVVASATAFHGDTDKEKVDRHLAALLTAFQAAKLEARQLRDQVDAKQDEIDDLKR